MIWVRIQRTTEQKNFLYLPPLLAHKLPSPLQIQFGHIKKLVFIQLLPEIALNNNSYHNPLPIQMSERLVEELLIQDSIIYQLRYTDQVLHLGPVIGLLLGDQRHYYHSSFMKEFTDEMSAYEKIGGLVIAFKECGIQFPEMCIYGLYYSPGEKKWHYGRLPLPTVVFRRAFKKTDTALQKLNTVKEVNVFNSLRLDKWQLYDKLKDFPIFRPYLPETEKLKDTKVLNKFVTTYPWIIIKPTDLSRGRGICIIKRIDDNQLLVHDYSQENCNPLIIERWRLPGYLRTNHFFERDYIIQPYLNLSKINGAPWDIRVVMQKDQNNHWRCHGIECRLAEGNSLLTNVSRGGQALFINQAAKLAFGSKIHPRKFKNDVLQIAKKFCRIMDDLGEHFAEFGLDIAVDVNKHYWFIEANIRPSFNGFKKLSYQNYLNICQAPILYAAFQAGFGRERKQFDTEI